MKANWQHCQCRRRSANLIDDRVSQKESPGAFSFMEVAGVRSGESYARLQGLAAEPACSGPTSALHINSLADES